jgi:excisionase family DNA binding protein
MYLSTKDAAVRAGVNERSIRRAIAENRLKAEGTPTRYLIHEDVLADFLAKRRHRGPKRPVERPQIEALQARIAELEAECATLRAPIQHPAPQAVPVVQQAISAPRHSQRQPPTSPQIKLKDFLTAHGMSNQYQHFYARICGVVDSPKVMITREQCQLLLADWERKGVAFQLCPACPHTNQS